MALTKDTNGGPAVSTTLNVGLLPANIQLSWLLGLTVSIPALGAGPNAAASVLSLSVPGLMPLDYTQADIQGGIGPINVQTAVTSAGRLSLSHLLIRRRPPSQGRLPRSCSLLRARSTTNSSLTFRAASNG